MANRQLGLPDGREPGAASVADVRTNGSLGGGHRSPDGPAPDGSEPVDPRAAFVESFRVDCESRYLLNNQTPYLIRIRHDDPEYGELVLPPFAQRVIKGARLLPFEPSIRLHRQRHEIFVRKYKEHISVVATLIWLAWIAVLALLGITIFDLLNHGSVARPEFYGGAAVTLAIAALVLLVAAVRESRRKKEAARQGTEAGDVAYGLGGSYSDGNETARSAQRLMTLALVLTVGAVLPAIAIIVATDAKDFLILEGGLRVKPNVESRLVARMIQITYTCVLSLFPALLFFQFDRQRAGNLRAEWVRALFRMDGRMRTLADVNATYGNALYEASSNSDDSVRGVGGKHSPIVIATVLIALGWTVLVVRTESFDFSGSTAASQQVQVAQQQVAIAKQAASVADAATSAEEANAAAATADAAAEAAASAQDATAQVADASTQATETTAGAGGSDGSATTTGGADDATTPTTLAVAQAQAAADAAVTEAEQAARAADVEQSQIQRTSFFQVLAPDPSAAGMAFLGAYFFGVYLVLRSYFAGDLRSKIYNQITARLVTVVVVAYLINAIFFGNTDQQEMIWALAFLAGVVPTTALQRLFDFLGGIVESVAGEVFSPDRPLEHIDGIDIYDSSRLETEGIPDVAALATSDLASVMLQTRLPIGRVIDWADQAALMVVVGTPGSQLDPRISNLRARGIRTGTDMLAAAERGDASVDEIIACLQVPPNPKFEGWWQRRRRAKQEAGAGPAAVSSERPVGAAAPGEGDDDEEGVVAERIAAQQVDIGDLCDAIRRQPVMSQILQWRSSALDDVDCRWIELPAVDAPPLVSASYQGPLPNPNKRVVPAVAAAD
jgi:hypothetical protein